MLFVPFAFPQKARAILSLSPAEQLIRSRACDIFATLLIHLFGNPLAFPVHGVEGLLEIQFQFFFQFVRALYHLSSCCEVLDNRPAFDKDRFHGVH
jgi:hypothetical protein